MSIHMLRQLERIRKSMLEIGGLVEESLQGAIRAVQQRDSVLAQKVIEGDREIDLAEIELEEECLKALALHRPVAQDLRFVVSVLKMNHDLERIGDLAVNMAERAVSLSQHPPIDIEPFRLGEMAQAAQVMLKQALDSLVRMDADLAQQVRKSDDRVDELERRAVGLVNEMFQAEPHRFEQLTCVLSVARQIERIADHAVNIAKDVLYMIKGDIVRHSRRLREAGAAQADQSAAGQPNVAGRSN